MGGKIDCKSREIQLRTTPSNYRGEGETKVAFLFRRKGKSNGLQEKKLLAGSVEKRRHTESTATGGKDRRSGNEGESPVPGPLPARQKRRNVTCKRDPRIRNFERPTRSRSQKQEGKLLHSPLWKETRSGGGSLDTKGKWEEAPQGKGSTEERKTVFSTGGKDGGPGVRGKTTCGGCFGYGRLARKEPEMLYIFYAQEKKKTSRGRRV